LLIIAGPRVFVAKTRRHYPRRNVLRKHARLGGRLASTRLLPPPEAG